ncbi:DEAD/DEAH box helicase [Nocardioides salsibiostraticola]
MGELLPSLAADGVRSGLLDFLETTFALSDDDARLALQEFLRDPRDGIFKGPYLRTRLPFRPAAEGWRDTLGWHPIDEAKPGAPGSFPPYGHQAEAFARLSSANLGDDKPAPLPTLVTTGTGSGKTEAFLYPILDHVLRAKASGVGGMKALILYPMNALANDQAQRLAELITSLPALGGVTAGLFTGQQGPQRTKVTADGLITDRHVMRSSAPDILLTNYKMLDQMLLRRADAAIWEQSATSLQYLVLDEFHTYDGAQGTDVAMLLRRLGLTLRAHGASGDTPLAQVTPIATSATLGDKGDPAAMLEFASLVFGQEFPVEAVVTESRLGIEEWIAQARPPEGNPRPQTGRDLIDDVNAAVEALGPDPEAEKLSDAVIERLYDPVVEGSADADLLRSHPMTRAVLEHSQDAVDLRDLAETLFPASSMSLELRTQFLSAYAGALSHVRKVAGRSMPSVEVHLWVRELTRIDREAVSADPTFWWSDDGSAPLGVDDDDRSHGSVFPAVYCRHCGRSGWGVALSPADVSTLDTSDTDIRRGHANGEARFRPLLLASREGDQALEDHGTDATQPAFDNLRWFDVNQRRLLAKPPADEQTRRDGSVLPVLTHVDSEADEASKKDFCPACQQRDGIRFLGSAVATQLSVGLSTLFGSVNLDQSEKKTLVFTDSVQDAAHRAGFVQSRSHSLTVRSMLRQAVGDEPRSLDLLAERVIQQAGDSADLRFRILPPDLADKDEFRPFWQAKTLKKVPQPVLSRVRKRISFDAVVEFGLQSHLGRTLEMTGSLAVEVEASRGFMLAAAKKAIKDGSGEALPVEADDTRLVAWVRGVLERMRERGSIEHVWLQKLIQEDGARHFIWRGRPKSQGMPAFPIGRTAPAFPRVGPKSAIKENVLDPVTAPQGWYAQWAMRVLHVNASEGAVLSRLLLKRLAEQEIILSVTNKGGAEVYSIPQDKVVVAPIADRDLQDRRARLICRTCKGVVPGTTTVVNQLDGAPCLVTRCQGVLERDEGDPKNFYRRFFAAKQIQRVVAREHTSLLDDVVRQRYEDGFKERIDDPAAPNVLVATPTLEMGIDIGDLSTVMLASLPRTVASYLQRVGRAGRLTGSALNLAFVSGRGEQLPQLGQPTSMINGKVRPPATYLDAEEILRRQYVAALADRQARNSAGVHPERTSTALGSMEPESYLYALATDAEASSSQDDGHLAEFLACFPSLAKTSINSLREWVTPVGDTSLTSPMAQRLIAESQRWHKRLETLGHRITQIEASIPSLLAAAELPLASDDDKDAYRSAQASLGLAKKQRAELTSEYWISALEEAGILPNYTLLDDSVTLDIGLSWIDPDSGEYATENVSYSRNAALALREFAPGATFYAGGTRAEINTVDLGNGGEAVREWVFCPTCGYSLDLTDGAQVPHSCPRCGNNAIADVAQRLSVVELSRVSSSMRRDEAAIDDSRDDRVREAFEVITTADYMPSDVQSQWFVKSHGFGAKHVTNLRLTWLNVGRSAGHGFTRFIAGNEIGPELFRVCSECGQVDRTANRNSKYEHRPWCSLREAPEEVDVSIALSRTLHTEGLVLRLPPMVSVGSSFAVPSLAAAIKLGLREHIGGAPDHLAMEMIVDPHLSDGTENADALLIHDLVPGGTGYLADLSDPENLYKILWGAYWVIRDCECAAQGRVACHLCLLPFAGYGQSKLVSRVEAERVLLDILRSGVPSDEEPDVSGGWDVTEEAGLAFDPESKMEQKFRQVLKERLDKLGATIKEHPEAKGVRLEITLGARRQWSLEPQVNVGSSKPDFVLRCTDPNVPQTAIFCDGWKFHASPQHNNLSEDARKREELRELGLLVLGFAWADLDTDPTPPDWFLEKSVPEVMKGAGISLKPALVALVRSGPLDQLLSWIQNPDPEGLADLGRALPFLFAPKAQTQGLSGQRSDLAKAAADILEGHPPAGSGVPVWAWREGGLVVMSRLNPKNKTTEIAVLLDDRDDSLGPDSRNAWRSWLRVSNLLALRKTGTTVTTLSRAGGARAPQAEAASEAPAGLRGSWVALTEAATDAEREVLLLLAEHALEQPKLGFEVDGLPLSVSWPDKKIVLDLDLTDEDRVDVRAHGWTIVPGQIDQLRDALEGSTT